MTASVLKEMRKSTNRYSIRKIRMSQTNCYCEFVNFAIEKFVLNFRISNESDMIDFFLVNDIDLPRKVNVSGRYVINEIVYLPYRLTRSYFYPTKLYVKK